MARYGCARWVPARYQNGKLRNGTPYTGGPRKVVHHKTVTRTDNAASLYGSSGSWPHFTVSEHGVQQHFDTAVGSRALRNKSGGVQTNTDGAIQIEIVGMPGETMPDATLRHLVALLKEIEDREGIPWEWPAGRPPKTSAAYGEHNGYRHPYLWDSTSGHYGHVQVPENTHWDPAYTNDEWWWLNAAMTQAATHEVTTTWKVQPMFHPTVPAVDALATPSGDGVWLLGENGAIFTTGKAPWLGGMNHDPNRRHWGNRVAARLERHGDGYAIIATTGERYVPKTA